MVGPRLEMLMAEEGINGLRRECGARTALAGCRCCFAAVIDHGAATDFVGHPGGSRGVEIDHRYVWLCLGWSGSYLLTVLTV